MRSNLALDTDSRSVLHLIIKGGNRIIHESVLRSARIHNCVVVVVVVFVSSAIFDYFYLRFTFFCTFSLSLSRYDSLVFVSDDDEYKSLFDLRSKD